MSNSIYVILKSLQSFKVAFTLPDDALASVYVQIHSRNLSVSSFPFYRTIDLVRLAFLGSCLHFFCGSQTKSKLQSV